MAVLASMLTGDRQERDDRMRELMAEMSLPRDIRETREKLHAGMLGENRVLTRNERAERIRKHWYIQKSAQKDRLVEATYHKYRQIL